ncbi:MAG: Ig-like domain-containing protein [Chloroflexia bacterium]
MVAVTALAYQFNLFAPFWGYDKLGFEVSGETGSSVSVSPIPAVSSGYKGVGGPITVPSLVRLLPAASATDVATDEPLRLRFDQPMDRASVESVFKIDPPASGVFSWDADNEVRFSPGSPGFRRGVTYRVVLSGTARSIAGTPLDEPISWSFRTRDLPSVAPDLPLDFARISPNTPLAFVFSVPMDEYETTQHVSLRAAGSQEAIPVALTWHEDGSKLSVSPRDALPEGKVSLHIGVLARTRSGETLGRSYEFTYDVALPTPRLRLVEGRLVVAALNSPLKVQYEAVAANASRPNADDVPLGNVDLKLYTLSADRLSALGAESNGWPRPLPAGFLDGLSSPDGVQVTLDTQAYGIAEILDLRAGIYLLSITAPSKAKPLSDWQILVVADGSLSLVEPGGPFWATGPDGRVWQNAEVSLYSPSGVLIEKGLTSDAGLWFPASNEEQASLAIAQDAEGHLVAFRCRAGSAECAGKVVQTPAPLILQTDRASYLPGQNVNFQVLTGSADGISQGTPVAEQDVSVSLLMPGGSTLSLLKLKPDSAGGAGGLFSLSPDLLPGLYTLRVSSGTATRDFPLNLEALSKDDLSVYIVPGTDLQTAQTSTLTRTVSIIGPGGAPAVGAVITATLRIQGDNWTSQAVETITDAQGRASVTLRLPDWAANYNEPGIYLHVEAVAQEQYGSATSYLDMTSTRSALAGVRQLVSPSLGVAVIAPPAEEGNTRLRVVGLGAQTSGSDLLVLAYSPSGEQASWSLDLSAHAASDVTLPIPARFAGGRVLIKRAGVEGSRELALLPPQNENISLQVTTAGTALPGASLPVALNLTDKDGQPLAGSASIQFRPVSGVLVRGVTHGWELNLSINTEGRGSATLSAPTMPGLWYVIAHAAALDGSHTWAWFVLRVSPGPFVQVPTAQNAVAEEAQAVSVVVHNPAGEALSTGLRVMGDPGLTALGNNSQRVDLQASGWERFIWRLLPLKSGLSTATFSFTPSASIEGSWPLGVQSTDNPRARTTYVSGSASGERLVGVQVPSGLSDNDVELEIHASTSLLTTLRGIAAALPSASNMDGDGAVAAARLSAGASVASAYRRLGASVPPALAYSAVERSLLLQQIYSGQRADGGWGMEGVGAEGISSVVATSHILLSLRRYNLVWADTGGDASAPAVDSTALNSGLAYLSFQASRPLPSFSEQALLDERANAFYVLSMYGMLDAELARPMMAYIGEKPGQGLSVNGQAWLAMALLQSGATQDALALVDRLAPEASEQTRASAPLLDAFVAVSHIEQQERTGPLGISDYNAAADATSRALMNSRQGIGWRSVEETASALWALSRYAAESGEEPQRDAPIILLNDHLVQTPTQPTTSIGPGTISIAVSGDALHAGTNWLKLRASEGGTLYFSLTLRATR